MPRPTSLRTEYAADPLGIDEPVPRFSWLPPGKGAVAYQLVVEPEPAAPESNRPGGGPAGWDSGRVESGASHLLEYDGPPLRALTRFRWWVRTWEPASRWSDAATFETGPLAPSDWGTAEWVSADLGPSSESSTGLPPGPLLRREFELVAGGEIPVVRARLYFCGLGYGEPYLDGSRVGTRLLDPAPTAYDRTALFSTYDVTSWLSNSSGGGGTVHVLGAMLGRGRYHDPTPNVWFWEQAPWCDRPKLLAQLVIWYADGQVQRIGTDSSWQASDGPVRSDSLFAGEVYDARCERPGWAVAGADPAGWRPVVPASPPGGALRSQQVPAIEAVRTVTPVGVASPSAGVHIYDLGEQVAGWARIAFSSLSSGTRVQVRYGERLRPDGRVDVSQVHIDGDIQTDTYVAKGPDQPEVYQPRFSYKGFRYVEVSGVPDPPALEDVRGIVVHSAVRSTAELESDSPEVNRLHAGVRRALLNNLHGIPTDTPKYEKNGWTGDAHLTAEVAAYNFQMGPFWTKWLRDWADAQLPSGELPPIVPTSGWGYHGSAAAVRGPIPAWDVAYLEIPWAMYRYYGDRQILGRHYDGQRRYLDYLVEGFVEDGVVLVGLGDYLPPGVEGIPPEGPGIYETAYTHRILMLLRSIAGVLGRDGDIQAYDELAARVRSGFDRTFFDTDSGVYRGEHPSGYRQSANVVPLAFEMVPESRYAGVLDRLLADIHERDDHLDTGVIGTKFLFPLLTRNGYVDVAYKLAMQPTYPGYGHHLQLGSTALYEMWGAGSRSRDHHFFGHVDRWFVEDLAGVSPSEPGYARVRIAPVPPAQLGSMRVALDTVRGRVEASWRRTSEGYDLAYDVPPGVDVEVERP